MGEVRVTLILFTYTHIGLAYFEGFKIMNCHTVGVFRKTNVLFSLFYFWWGLRDFYGYVLFLFFGGGGGLFLTYLDWTFLDHF